MDMLAVAILDKKANQLHGGTFAIMISNHTAPLLRMVREMSEQPGSVLAKYPHDFTVVQLGAISLADPKNGVTFTPDFQTIIELDVLLEAK